MADYLVFARQDFHHAVEHRGEVSADDDEQARRQAIARFGGDWVQMTLVPAASVHWVLRQETAETRPERHPKETGNRPERRLPKEIGNRPEPRPPQA